MDKEEFARAPGKGKAKGKAKAKPKGTGKVKAKASGEGRKRKQQLSRGGVPPGGRGFVCPVDGCDHVEDTAAEVLAHVASQCGGEGRTRDDDGKSACLWDGCGKLMNVGCMKRGKWYPWRSLRALRGHEERHEKGGPPRGFVCPSSDCEQNYPTSEEAWAHAEEAHEIESNEKMCLWDGCGYVATQGRHTGRTSPSTPGSGRPSAPPAAAVKDSEKMVRAPFITLLLPLARPASCSTQELPPLTAPNPLPHAAEWAAICCVITAACNCGWELKGHDGPGATSMVPPSLLPSHPTHAHSLSPRMCAASFKKHQQRCGQGVRALTL